MLKLTTDPHQYVRGVLESLDSKISRGRRAFAAINILIIVSTLATAVITAIVMSKMISSDIPTWFFFATAGITAFIGFLGAIVNFFVIDERVKTAKRRKVFVEQEIIKYSNKLSKKYKTKDADFFLFTSVAAAIQNKAAKKEVGRE